MAAVALSALTTEQDSASTEIIVAIYISAKHATSVNVLVSLANIAILEPANTLAPMEPVSLQTDVLIATKTYTLKSSEESETKLIKLQPS